MRVGVFTDTYFPQINGVATSIMMLAKHLQAKGHQVFIFTTTDPNAAKDESNVFRFPSLPVLDDKRLGMVYHPSLSKLVRDLDLDVIHTHTEFSLGASGRYLAKKLHIPMVHTMHTVYEDYTHYLVKGRVFDPLAKAAVRKASSAFCSAADCIIVPTEKVKALMLSYGIETEISIISTGVELDRFAPGKYGIDTIESIRQTLGIGTEEKVILFVGRMAKEKNIHELLELIRQYLKKTEGVRFLLIGDGAERPKLELLAKDLGIMDKTIFAGARPWEEIGMYYQTGDVFVNTSQSEAQGLTYIEAMAAGLPVVARSDQCLEGVLLDEVNGYSFEDRAGFEAALDSILFNDIQCERLRQGALETAKRFSASEYAEKVSEVYAGIAAVSRK